MPLLDRSGWIADDFSRAENVSAGGAVLVPFALVEAALAGASPGQRVGAEIENTVRADALEALGARLDLISVRFPAPGDGRGFSIGRALRDQGYEGRLRAAGELVPDQLAFAFACGFDEVEISEERAARQPIAQWLAAAGAIGVTYQPGRDGRHSIFAERRASAA